MPNIPCPKCSTTIEFDFKTVLDGKDFICKNCNSKITLTYSDNKTIFKNAQKALDKLKDNLDID
ncbi:hypothetical protein [Psychroserpens algicola]|uniref:hypothetical protein n=1 Tax=Psychroserpens algicola TaxID=1719034 RepID=UPI001953676C|nr:hypothetical protein [Psychroserpens algicola]